MQVQGKQYSKGYLSMKYRSALGLVLLVATPALAQSIGEKSGVNLLVGMAPSTQDFVTEAAQGDMFEFSPATWRSLPPMHRPRRLPSK